MALQGDKGIGWAMHTLQGGGKVRRGVWKYGIFLGLTGLPEKGPVIMECYESTMTPYQASQGDLLARDWEVVR